jgi:electron transfer flavoprotein alpha/beta subunit
VRIVVCLNAAPAGAAAVAPGDRRALALALALPGDREVIALLAGSAEDAAPLQAALTAGADRAARIPGQSSSSTDFHTLGKCLASAATNLRADLVLTGARADAEGLGALSAVVARQMRLPHLANVEALELLPDRRLAVTVRGGGLHRRLAVTLPAALSVAGSAALVPAPRDALPAIEILAPIDPEATVLRRRTEILGESITAPRDTKTVATAAELITALVATKV